MVKKGHFYDLYCGYFEPVWSFWQTGDHFYKIFINFLEHKKEAKMAEVKEEKVLEHKKWPSNWNSCYGVTFSKT